MFFIFGWNRPSITEYGPVKQELCYHCHNTEMWHLRKISRYFTLFFIPIFPHDSEILYLCPICNHGIQLSMADFESYKEIAQVNKACLENQITEEERAEKLDKISADVKKRQEERNLQDLEKSKSGLPLLQENLPRN
ncbi:MAG: hypothetical protein JWO09_1129 [Bacteroidetes bacterium]|nr:hypothetical protein [Bacteroidota bacterium]